MDDIYSLAYELKDLLTNDERFVLLDKLEEKINNNENVMALSYQKDLAVSNYSDAINHFPKDSDEVKKAQHELHLKKEELDNYPLVKEYLKAYNVVRDLLFNINNILFSNLSLHMKENN